MVKILASEIQRQKTIIYRNGMNQYSKIANPLSLR